MLASASLLALLLAACYTYKVNSLKYKLLCDVYSIPKLLGKKRLVVAGFDQISTVVQGIHQRPYIGLL